MTDSRFDLIVIGGGVFGLGTAVEAGAARAADARGRPARGAESDRGLVRALAEDSLDVPRPALQPPGRRGDGGMAAHRGRDGARALPRRRQPRRERRLHRRPPGHARRERAPGRRQGALARVGRPAPRVPAVPPGQARAARDRGGLPARHRLRGGAARARRAARRPGRHRAGGAARAGGRRRRGARGRRRVSRPAGRGGRGRLVEAALSRARRRALAMPAGHHVPRGRARGVLPARLRPLLRRRHGLLRLRRRARAAWASSWRATS